MINSYNQPGWLKAREAKGEQQATKFYLEAKSSKMLVNTIKSKAKS